MADKPFPQDESGINLLLQNLAAKINSYKVVLGITNTDVTFLSEAAANYQYLINITPQVSDSKEAFTQFKGDYINGDANDPVPAAPVFPSISVPNPAVLGIVPGTKGVIKRIKASAAYTDTIGEDLGLVDTGGKELVENLTAALTLKALSNSRVEVSFSKQGQDAMKVMFKRQGDAAWSLAGIYTSSPGVHDVANVPPDEPESREYKGVLLKKNAEVGNESPAYTVVTTP